MTGAQLAALCAAQDGLPYVWGGLGYTFTEARLSQLKRLYANVFTSAYETKVRKFFGKPVFDCVGLPKFFLWGNTEAGKLLKYGANGIPDTSANGLFNLCTEKGVISTLPEISGLLLHRDGHVGVYLGNGKLVEARGVDYGVVISEVSKRNFTSWGKLPGVEYAAAPAPESKAVTFAEAAEILKAQGITSITL